MKYHLHAAVVALSHDSTVSEQSPLLVAGPQVVEERPLVHRPGPLEARRMRHPRLLPLVQRVLDPLPPPHTPHLDGLGVEPVQRSLAQPRHEVAVPEGRVVGEAAAPLHGLRDVQSEARGRAAHAQSDDRAAVCAASGRGGAAVHARPRIPAVGPRPGTDDRDALFVAQREEEAVVVRPEHLGGLGPGRRGEEPQPKSAALAA